MKRYFAAAMAFAALAASPARAEIVEVADRGFVTRTTATVSANPQQVWLELIAPGGWWSDTHTWSGDAANLSIVPQGGGCFCERIPATEKDGAVGLDGSVQHMVVVQASPRKVLRMKGALGPLQSEPVEGVLTITLKPMEKGTRILWEYAVGGYMRYKPDVIAKSVDDVLTAQLGALASKLGRVPDPEAKVVAPAKPEAAAAPASKTDDAAAKAPPAAKGQAIGKDFLKGETAPAAKADGPPPKS
ncbi:SRPBCC family protein [Parerythrobacter aurantius]|uniref:SRPBCC family protein n=1 Tax=Parerythrobacter aurantius TaxID=3127706 RepID=UPI00324AB879